MPIGGGALRRLAATPADEAQPAWSPDGTQIAFTSARDRGGRLSAVVGPERAVRLRPGPGRRRLPRAGGRRARGEARRARRRTPRGLPTARRSSSRATARGTGTSGRSRRRAESRGRSRPTPTSTTSRAGRRTASGSPTPPCEHSRRPAEGRAERRRRARELKVPGGAVVSPAWSADGAWLYFAAGDARSPRRPRACRACSVATAGDRDAARPAAHARRSGRHRPRRRGERPAARLRGRLATRPTCGCSTSQSGAVRQLTATSCLEDYPDLSPDGRTLVFFSDRTGESAPLHARARRRRPAADDRRAGLTCRAGLPTARPLAYVRRTPQTTSVALQPVGGLTVRTSSPCPATGGVQGAASGRRTAGRSRITQTRRGRPGVDRVVDLAGASREVAAPEGSGVPDVVARTAGSWRSSARRTGPAPSGWWRPTAARPGRSAAARASCPTRSGPEGPRPHPRRRRPQEPRDAVGRDGRAHAPHALRRLDPLRRLPELVADGTQVYFSMTRKIGDL